MTLTHGRCMKDGGAGRFDRSNGSGNTARRKPTAIANSRNRNSRTVATDSVRTCAGKLQCAREGITCAVIRMRSRICGSDRGGAV